MKKFTFYLVILLGLSLSFTSCKEDFDEPTTPNSTSTTPPTPTDQDGYASISASCSNSPSYYYLTGYNFYKCNYFYKFELGIGYNSTDIANEAYFKTVSTNTSFKITNYSIKLPPGVYYCKAKRTCTGNTCSNDDPSYVRPADISRSASFTVTAGKTTTVSVPYVN